MKAHWWTIGEVARLYRVGPSKVQRWVRSGRLDAELHRDTMLISSSSLSGFIAARGGMRREKLRDPDKNWLDLTDGA